jgi:hypothetical protein
MHWSADQVGALVAHFHYSRVQVVTQALCPDDELCHCPIIALRNNGELDRGTQQDVSSSSGRLVPWRAGLCQKFTMPGADGYGHPELETHHLTRNLLGAQANRELLRTGEQEFDLRRKFRHVERLVQEHFDDLPRFLSEFYYLRSPRETQAWQRVRCSGAYHQCFFKEVSDLSHQLHFPALPLDDETETTVASNSYVGYHRRLSSVRVLWSCAWRSRDGEFRFRGLDVEQPAERFSSLVVQLADDAGGAVVRLGCVSPQCRLADHLEKDWLRAERSGHQRPGCQQKDSRQAG